MVVVIYCDINLIEVLKCPQVTCALQWILFARRKDLHLHNRNLIINGLDNTV